MRVAVIHGGTSTEHDVSIASGRGIIDALHEGGHDPVSIVIDREGGWSADGSNERVGALSALLGCDVAIPAMHGLGGEDGTIQGLLESLGVPYVGSGVKASAVCLDKALTKSVVSGAGVPVAPGITIGPERVADAVASEGERSALLLDLAHAGVRIPFFVKPIHGGSSIGVTRVADRADLVGALVAAGDDAVLIESELVGLEVDVPVLELPDGTLQVGPTLLIDSDPAEPFFSEAAKYSSTATRFTVPAPLSAIVTQQLEALALEAFRALGCAGLARVDFFVTSHGPILNEVNTFPGFTAHSQFPQMWAAAGFTYPELVDALLRTAIAKRPAACFS